MESYTWENVAAGPVIIEDGKVLLDREMKDNTLIFISHRFSTIKDAERIIVIDKGKIIEDGTHDELIKRKSKYAKLYTIQAERYLRANK